jgi:hypothetical protein
VRTVILGNGFVAGNLCHHLGRIGVGVERVPAAVLHDLDRSFPASGIDQIVVLLPAGGELATPLLDRIDGPRWLVCSWRGDAGADRREPTPAPGDPVLGRGGARMRLASVFGRGGDDHVTRIARWVRRSRTPIGAGRGGPLVQPLHVDDLGDLVARHLCRPVPGSFDIAGPEAVPVGELCQSIGEIVGAAAIGRLAAPLVSAFATRGSGPLGAVARHAEGVPVDIARARGRFGWRPLPLGVRVEQAVQEALA